MSPEKLAEVIASFRKELATDPKQYVNQTNYLLSKLGIGVTQTEDGFRISAFDKQGKLHVAKKKLYVLRGDSEEQNTEPLSGSKNGEEEAESESAIDEDKKKLRGWPTMEEIELRVVVTVPTGTLK